MALVPVIRTDEVVIIDGDNNLGPPLLGHKVADVAAIVRVEGDQRLQPGEAVEEAILFLEVHVPGIESPHAEISSQISHCPVRGLPVTDDQRAGIGQVAEPFKVPGIVLEQSRHVDGGDDQGHARVSHMRASP